MAFMWAILLLAIGKEFFMSLEVLRGGAEGDLNG
jgi:hypothetical protein